MNNSPKSENSRNSTIADKKRKSLSGKFVAMTVFGTCPDERTPFVFD